MRKLSVLIFISVFSLSVFAQNREVIMVGETRKTDTIVTIIEPVKPKYQPHAVGIETGPGFGFGCMEDNMAIGLNASIRYTWNFMPYVGWDVIKFKFSANDWFEQIGYINVLSGIKLSTPRFGKSKSSYGYTAFRFGLAYYRDSKLQYRDYSDGSPWPRGIESYYLDFEKLGFTWECDIAGIHFKYFFMNIKYSYLNAKHFIGYSLGVDFGKLKEIKKKQ